MRTHLYFFAVLFPRATLQKHAQDYLKPDDLLPRHRLKIRTGVNTIPTIHGRFRDNTVYHCLLRKTVTSSIGLLFPLVVKPPYSICNYYFINQKKNNISSPHLRIRNE